MDVTEVKTAKRNAESAIKVVLEELQEKTGCHVRSLNLSTYNTINGVPNPRVEIDLEVP